MRAFVPWHWEEQLCLWQAWPSLVALPFLVGPSVFLIAAATEDTKHSAIEQVRRVRAGTRLYRNKEPESTCEIVPGVSQVGEESRGAEMPKREGMIRTESQNRVMVTRMLLLSLRYCGIWSEI